MFRCATSLLIVYGVLFSLSWVLHSCLLVCPRSFLRCLFSESFCKLVVLRGALGGVCGICLVLSGVDQCGVVCVPGLL